MSGKTRAGGTGDAGRTVRCEWAGSDPLYVAYHDEEWGVPVHDDRLLFEFLILEGAQAGLSWITILRKRAAYRAAFDRFDPAKVARYDARRVQGLLSNPAIVRNRAKIEATIANAAANGVEVEARLVDATADELPTVGTAVLNVALEIDLVIAPRLSAERAITSGYLVSETPDLPGYRLTERRESDGWAADLHIRTK